MVMPAGYDEDGTVDGRTSRLQMGSCDGHSPPTWNYNYTCDLPRPCRGSAQLSPARPLARGPDPVSGRGTRGRDTPQATSQTDPTQQRSDGDELDGV